MSRCRIIVVVRLAVASGLLLAGLAGSAEAEPAVGPGPTTEAVGQATRFDVPGGSFPTTITQGPDGNVWFVEKAYSRIGRITPSGTLTTFDHPEVANPTAIVSGPDGNLWFTYKGSVYGESLGPGLGRITPSGTITTFTSELLLDPEGLVVGPDGALWMTSFDALVRATTSGGFTRHPIAQTPSESAMTFTIAVGADGRLWHDADDEHVGAMTTGGTDSLVALSQPADIDWLRAGPGGTLWFSTTVSVQIGTLATDGTLSPVTLPGIFTARAPVPGPDGNVWAAAVTTGFDTGVVRITPAGASTFFPVGAVNELTAGPQGTVWFTDVGQVGRIDAVAAGATRRPDGRIRRGTGAFAGDGTYNTTGTSQTAADSRRPGQAATFTLSLQNDGSDAEKLRVAGQGSTSQVTVAYFSGATNVTAAVVAGTYKTPPLAPGADHRLRMTVTPRAGALVGTVLTRKVTASSDNDATVKDVVKAKVTRLR